MPTIFEQLEKAHDALLSKLSQYEAYDEGHRYSWPNYVFTSNLFRRAHLDVVDARDTKKLYMLHLTVMPHVNDPAPIFGFDIIAGPNKVTGAFHDFSQVGDHPLNDWFAAKVDGYEWSKKRNLPDWAKEIFSSKMVAAGNIQTEQELETLLLLVRNNLDHYLTGVGNAMPGDFTELQNRYCFWQKQNPHTPRVMESLGLDPKEIEAFIQTCLFPEIRAVHDEMGY